MDLVVLSDVRPLENSASCSSLANSNHCPELERWALASSSRIAADCLRDVVGWMGGISLLGLVSCSQSIHTFQDKTERTNGIYVLHSFFNE